MAALANVREPTIDISPQELSLAAARVANDVRVPGAADESTMSIPVRVPGARSRRWLWGALALPVLLVAVALSFEFLPLVGFTIGTPPAPRNELEAADRHEKASERVTASDEIEVPRAPEANSAPPPEQSSALGETSADARQNAFATDPAALDEANQAARTRADQLTTQGNALRKRRKFGPARSKYRAALAAFPDHPGALDGLTQLDTLARKRLKRSPRR